MEDLFLESLSGAVSRSGAAGVWVGGIADVLRRAPIEHWRARKRRPDRITDLRHAARRLSRSPVFTIVSWVTLAVAIGANTAIFTVVDSILLKPLPFHESDRLVGVWHTRRDTNNDVPMPPQLYFAYREQGRTFEDIGVWDDASVSVTGAGEPEQVMAIQVTDGVFPLLRVQPLVGRVFTREDDTPGSPMTAMLSYGYWQRRFGGDPRVIGSTISVNGHPREIIAVLPQRFRFLDRNPSLFLPFQFDQARLTAGQALTAADFTFRGIARLRPGATIEQANADIERMIPIAAATLPAGGITLEMMREAGFGPSVRPLDVDVVGDIGGTLWVLLGTVGIVLIIAVANVANLFLVRAEGRRQELAVRAALGPDRWRIARALLAESLTLVVSQRTREIGVRMALGAMATDVSRLVLRHALALAGAGIAIGLVAAAALTQAMSALLFGISALDPLTYGAAAAGLTAIALLASWLPVRRAMNVDPIDALRWD